jgi:hypothetical protein
LSGFDFLGGFMDDVKGAYSLTNVTTAGKYQQFKISLLLCLFLTVRGHAVQEGIQRRSCQKHNNIKKIELHILIYFGENSLN